MQVTSTTSATNAPTTTPVDQSPPTLGYNSFLQLLIAEMKNQDPTKPMDSAQYVAQLATFSSVEQAVQTNSKLDSLMTSFALNQAEGLIGHPVASADGSISGVVQAVKVVSGGAVAELDNGQQLTLGAGVIIG